MHAQRLTTRINLDAFPGEACLLVYDELQLTGTILGDDIREVFDTRPGTVRIYILAPFVPEQQLREYLQSGAAFTRISSYFNAIGGRLCLLSFSLQEGQNIATAIPFFIDDAGHPQQEDSIAVHDELRNGWLFDLFDRYRGRIDAPPGVHFSKSSGRHSYKFLRVSNILLSSSDCALIAYFVLGTLRCGQPRRIFVDTASLLPVAFALQRIALTHEIWNLYAPVKSFSSYGGLDKLPTSSGRDLILVSASTSGGLVSQLLSKDFAANYIATLFYLGNSDTPSTPRTIICDLTFRQGRMFGYPLIESFPAENCPLCSKGYFLAELEGDQFQLEKRARKEFSVTTSSQTQEARKTLDNLARKNLISAFPFRQRGLSSDFAVDADSMLGHDGTIRNRFMRALRRYMPMPLQFVILIDLSEQTFRDLINIADLNASLNSARIISYEELLACEPLAPNIGGALVVFGTLSNFAKARDINAQLRIKVPKGCVAYVSGITIANSAEHLADLKMFLTYGELGRDTFTYEAACSLMLPSSGNGSTAWELELALLQQIREEGNVAAEIDARLDSLLNENSRTNVLFWPGRQQELTIQNDFVYLEVDVSLGPVSQADVLAIVSNLLVTARMDNRGLNARSKIGQEPIHWHQSVYGHIFLSPATFENYNDAILHAAFLRSATAAELNYANDEISSGRISSVVRAQIQAWASGGGDSLPEFFIALATHRLALTTDHIQTIREAANASSLPNYLLSIIATI
ncbi:MAG: hypothetical protein V4495_19865 [Pseudomonadota bacterium]